MELEKLKLTEDLRENTVNLRTLMQNTSDLVIKYGKVGGRNICLITCENMVCTDTVANMIFRPLNDIGNIIKLDLEDLVERIQNEIMIAVSQNTITSCEEIAKFIMSGFAVLLIEGLPSGLALAAQGFKFRSVEETKTHLNLRSSREGFNEVVQVNISLLRRRIKSPKLVFKMMTLGDLTQTNVCLCYISNKADPKLVEQVAKKLNSIEISDILESGYLQPFLEDRGNMIFSEVGVTERPDTMAAKLYEGRVGILVDGTPFSLYLPHLFIENFQTMDDYTGNVLFMGMVRVLRYFAFALTILLPGFYVAIANFHPELFPSNLLFNLALSVAATPYPILVECVIIHIVYEIMREAGLRLPIYVGHTISIVGGLVIGDIVVSAGVIGAPIALIAAVGAISSFIVPDLYDSIIVLRFAFMFAGGLWGLYGIALAAIVVLFKVSSMGNFGIPFTAPISPFTLKSMRDTFFHVRRRSWVKNQPRVQDLNGVKINDVE